MEIGLGPNNSVIKRLWCIYIWVLQLLFQISPISQRTEALTVKAFQKFLDPDGRLVDESALRKAVFLGTISEEQIKCVFDDI